MERVLAIKANYLAAADHDVTVVTADQGGVRLSTILTLEYIL